MKPVILCGGAGTRVWPVSTPRRPKPLIPFPGRGTLLEATVRRWSPLGRPQVVVGPGLILPELDADVIVEPAPRGTAAAVLTLAAAHEGLVCVVPADHRVDDEEALRDAVLRGADLAETGALVLLGAVPDRPATGFGWMEVASADAPGPIRHFHEKPDVATAAAWLAGGRHLWNLGIFLFDAATLLEAAAELEPAWVDAARRAADGAAWGPSFLEIPAASFDRAIVERLTARFAVPVDAGWDDLGTWAAIHRWLDADADGNVIVGPVVAEGCRGSLLWSEGVPVRAREIDGAVVVATPEGVRVGEAQLPTRPGATLLVDKSGVRWC